ncbi:MAG: septum formation initiator family protein [Clostridiales bacterium]|nr:septum formation initiator family protein [Clostridiales bacterium]
MKALFLKLKQNKRIRFTAAAVLLLAFFFGCGDTVVSQTADINRLKKEEAAYSSQLSAQQDENAALEAILDSDDKDAYIEQKARERGYVKSDEIVFYDIAGSN